MELCLKRTFTTTLLLLLLALHPVHLQNSTVTDSTETTTGAGKTLPQSWLRQKPKFPIIPKENDGTNDDDPNGLKPMESEDPSTDDGNGLQPFDTEDLTTDDNNIPPMENDDTSTSEGNGRPFENEDTLTDTSGLQNPDGSGTDDQSGKASGYMLIDEPTEDSTQPSLFQNNTILESEDDDFNVSTTTQSPDVGVSVTDSDTLNNDTVLERVDEVTQNSTSAVNVTDVQTTTTSAPETNATQPSDVGSGEGISENTTATTSTPLPETTTRQHSSTTSTVLSTTVTKETTTELSETAETTTSVPASTERANQSDKVAGSSGGAPERGFGSESERRQRKSAWGAVLGTFVAIAVVGLVAYVILKKKHHKAFSHRKLEEDFPSDPVLRLDNSEPLDLNFGRAAYYNPGLQGDNIQMSTYPKN